jgi:hydrogenase maturation protein HypF
MIDLSSETTRISIQIAGSVQGVGFRPFAHALASRFILTGFVKNQRGNVLIEVQGKPRLINSFLTALKTQLPPPASITHMTYTTMALQDDHPFSIEESDVSSMSTISVPSDLAPCKQCLLELADPSDRHHLYPFLSCAHCGPRFTVIQSMPYDRERTTLTAFPLCVDCQAEFKNTKDRRFHVQGLVCPKCGPQYSFIQANGECAGPLDPLLNLATALHAGRICAIKGVGGYQICCDARNSTAVRMLRQRKYRLDKPFAIMVKDLEQAESLCEISAQEKEALLSSARPIVLMRIRINSGLAVEVNPGNPFLGIMLPSSPLHVLLLNKLGSIPLVMTSANISEEPILYQDSIAIAKLSTIVDGLLIHNRPIEIGCDDSVLRFSNLKEILIRRARGYAPKAIELPFECTSSILALGGQLKATVALGLADRAILSHHLGDLNDFSTYEAYNQTILHFENLFEFTPSILVHDLHPDYESTRYAAQRAKQQLTPKIELIAVQHHHAHIASCMAENRITSPVIGVAFDGTGYGTDGAIWGGEFLIANYAGFMRGAHLRYVPMPGGEQVIREPWRMGCSYLYDAGLSSEVLQDRIDEKLTKGVRSLLDRKTFLLFTSSIGRLFDGVASLLDLCDRVTFEGQAAMELEWESMRSNTDRTLPFEINRTSESDSFQIDFRPLIRGIVLEIQAGTARATIARMFHSTLAKVTAEICLLLRTQTGINQVALSGGVFMNALLLDRTHCLLTQNGFEVFTQRLVPPNDGGLSLGQLAVAAARICKKKDRPSCA